MPKKLPDMSSASGLGDIDDILHNQSVSDLGWLDVDVEEYRKFEALPRQNLDFIPEVSRALIEDDRDPRVPMRVPLRQAPIVNSNPLEAPSPPVRSSIASVRDRVAAYVMSGMGDRQIRERLLSEFDPGTLRASGPKSLEVLRERGLLGNVYVDASHFPRCAQDGPHRAFVAKRCARSLYVLSKPECAGCVQNVGGRCASFKKLVVDEVPYGERTYAHYLPQLRAERRASDGDAPPGPGEPGMSDQDRKERLRAAFLRPPVPVREAPPRTFQRRDPPAKPRITEEDIQDFWRRRSSAEGPEPLPSPIYLMAARRIMLGTADARSLIASSDQEVRQLALEHGILGSTYLDGDALGGPREALDLIRSRSLTPDFVLVRKAYSDPRSADALTQLSRITEIVQRRPGIGRESFARACARARSEGRMSGEQAESAVRNVPDGADWARLTAQANLFTPPRPEPAPSASPAPRGSFHHGETGKPGTARMDAEEVRRTVSHMMNAGLSGKALRNAVLARYARSDLVQVPEVGAALSADDGVQGHYFIDPTAYRDYGRGCAEGSRHFRKHGAPNVLASGACTGCRLQTAPGWCSKYAKRLIRQIPDEVRTAAAERRRLPLAPSNDAPVTNPVEEWGLAAELPVEIGSRPNPGPEISVPSPDVSG